MDSFHLKMKNYFRIQPHKLTQIMWFLVSKADTVDASGVKIIKHLEVSNNNIKTEVTDYEEK